MKSTVRSLQTYSCGKVDSINSSKGDNFNFGHTLRHVKPEKEA